MTEMRNNDDVNNILGKRRGDKHMKSNNSLPKPINKALTLKKTDNLVDLYSKIINTPDVEEQINPKKQLENIFRTICIGDGPEIFHIKHCNMNRSNLKMFLSKRYPQKLAERLSQNFFMLTPNSFQMGYQKYIEYFTNFLKFSQHSIQSFCFKCYNISNTGFICEHDIFQIFQNCKEYIPIQSYITLLEDEKLYNDVDSMIKDDLSDLFTNVFVPDISKVADLINKNKYDLLETSENKSNKEEEQYLGLKGYLELDKYTIMDQAFKRYKMSTDLSKPTSDITLNVFEHKNIFTATASKLPPCAMINEEDFCNLEFEYGTPNLFNDLVKYLTGGLIDPHEYYKKEAQKIKYIERMSSLSPVGKQNTIAPVTYSQEDLNSVKFWNLVDPNLGNNDAIQNINMYEQYLSEKKQK